MINSKKTSQITRVAGKGSEKEVDAFNEMSNSHADRPIFEMHKGMVIYISVIRHAHGYTRIRSAVSGAPRDRQKGRRPTQSEGEAETGGLCYAQKAIANEKFSSIESIASRFIITESARFMNSTTHSSDKRT